MQYLLSFLAKIDFYFLVLKMAKNTDDALQSYVLDCFMYKKWIYINRLLLMQRKTLTESYTAQFFNLRPGVPFWRRTPDRRFVGFPFSSFMKISFFPFQIFHGDFKYFNFGLKMFQILIRCYIFVAFRLFVFVFPLSSQLSVLPVLSWHLVVLGSCNRELII